MKKSLVTLTILATLTACSPAIPSGSSIPVFSASPNSMATTDSAEETQTDSRVGTVSNLADDASLSEVREILRNAGISDTQISAFEDQVHTFTNAVPTDSLTSGFEPSTDVGEYDFAGLITGLDTNRARLTNCRITTYTLAKDIISVESDENADTSILFIDAEQIETEPRLFTEAEEANFNTIYGRVATTREKDQDTQIGDIHDYNAAHGITFADGPASVVSVYMHDTLEEQAYMFIGHTGLLVEADDGLLFIEKLAFDEPYQATWFADRAALSDYLMTKYSDGPDMEYSVPVIFENNDVIEGYVAK